MNAKFFGVIPMKPHLKKFLVKEENLEEGQAWDVAASNGMLAYNFQLLVTNKTNILKNSYTPSSSNNVDYTDKLHFKITSRMLTFNCFHWNGTIKRAFNNSVWKLMNELLYRDIIWGQKHNIPKKDIIMDFASYYDIEEDFDVENLIKSSFRLRKSKNLGPFCPQKRPVVENNWKSAS